MLMDHSGGARLFILVPVPRYVRGPCCGDGGHITNRSEDDFFNEILGAEKRVTEAAAAGHRTREAKVIDLCKLFGSAETPIHLTAPQYEGDSVHLTSPAYRVAARLLIAELERADHGEVGEPALKRARLESVVLAPHRHQQSRRLSSRRQRRNLSRSRSGSPDSYRRGLATTTRAADRATTMVE
jgi:hypothetical protein